VKRNRLKTRSCGGGKQKKRRPAPNAKTQKKGDGGEGNPENRLITIFAGTWRKGGGKGKPQPYPLQGKGEKKSNRIRMSNLSRAQVYIVISVREREEGGTSKKRV